MRAPLLRATIHLVGSEDCLALRPLLQPVLERTFAGTQYRRDLDGLDRDEVAAAGRALVEERPRTRAELGRLLGERWPGREPGSLAQAVTYRLPLVQVPPRGLWAGAGRRPGRRPIPGSAARSTRIPRRTRSCSATSAPSAPRP